MLDKILKIQNFIIRELPSSRTLLVDTLSKYEANRNRLECALPIPVDPSHKPGIETLTAARLGTCSGPLDFVNMKSRVIFAGREKSCYWTDSHQNWCVCELMCERQAGRFNIAYFRYFMTFGSDFNEMSTEKVLFWSDHFTVFPK